MHRSAIGLISIILLLIGSISLLAMGLDLISSSYVLVAVLVCFINSVRLVICYPTNWFARCTVFLEGLLI